MKYLINNYCLAVKWVGLSQKLCKFSVKDFIYNNELLVEFFLLFFGDIRQVLPDFLVNNFLFFYL